MFFFILFLYPDSPNEICNILFYFRKGDTK